MDRISFLDHSKCFFLLKVQKWLLELRMFYNSFYISGLGHCPICDNKGFKMVLDGGKVDFEYSTSLLRFTAVSKLYVYVPHKFDGGIVLSLD